MLFVEARVSLVGVPMNQRRKMMEVEKQKLAAPSRDASRLGLWAVRFRDFEPRYVATAREADRFWAPSHSVLPSVLVQRHCSADRLMHEL